MTTPASLTLQICRVCDSRQLEPVIDLGQQPWCNHFLKPSEVGKEPFYSLKVLYCTDCSTAQLDTTVPKEIMFGDHTYLSGVTRSLSDHFRQMAVMVRERFFPRFEPGGRFSVLDIGSNDGTQLRHFKEQGWDILGVESSKTTAKIANDAGLTTENAFFNQALVKRLGRQFDVINAAGVFFHLEELHSVTQGIRDALKPEGVFMVQFLYMKKILENGAFDQIYHEHLLYYNLKTIERLLERHDLMLFDAWLAPIHGGSMIGYVQHRDQAKHRPVTDRLKQLRAEEDASGANSIEAYRQFARDIAQMKEENLSYLKNAKAKGKRVYGMGAPVKGNTMLNYFGVGPDLIQWLVEKNTLRKGLVAPGSHIPLVLEDELTAPPDIYYVLAWNFKHEILKNNRALMDQGVEFYFPVDPDRPIRGVGAKNV